MSLVPTRISKQHQALFFDCPSFTSCLSWHHIPHTLKKKTHSHSSQVLVINQNLVLALRSCRKTTIFSSFSKTLQSYLKWSLTKNQEFFFLPEPLCNWENELVVLVPQAIYLCRVNLGSAACLFTLLYLRKLPYFPEESDWGCSWALCHTVCSLKVTRNRVRGSLFLNELWKANIKGACMVKGLH